MLRDGPLSGPERDDTQVNPGGEVAAGDAILPVEAANVDHFGKTRTFVMNWIRIIEVHELY